MKTIDPALTTAFRQSHNIQVRPRLTVEWNLNRYHATTVDNYASEEFYNYDDEMFPIESVIEPNRPVKGIAKGRSDAMIVANDDPLKQNVRFYVADVDDVYKYWTSPVATNGSGVFPTFTSSWVTSQGYTSDPAADNDTVVRPYIAYDQVVQANKIVIKTENSWSSPNSYQVLIRTTVGGAWTGISTTGLNNATGQVTLWWNGSSWVTTRPAGTLLTTGIAGVMFRVVSMTSGKDLSGANTTYLLNNTVQTTNGNNAFFNLIEIAACLEADLSSKFISASDTFDMSEVSLVYPMGTITGQVGSISLSNLYNDAEFGIGSDINDKPGLFDNENDDSPFQGLIEQNAQFNLEYIYTVGGTDYAVQQFKMYCGSWSSSTDEQINLEMRDYSKFFDEQTPNPVFFLGRTVSEIVWRICDQVGFVDYEVSVDTNDNQPIINYFWTDGEKTVWQIFDELSKGTQTAIYFDSFGVLQIKSRRTAFDSGASPAWTLRGENAGAELADVISLEPRGEAQTNHVTITYHGTDFTDWNHGSPLWNKGTTRLARVWQPEGTVALRAAVLQNSINTSSTFITLSPDEVKVWPYSGLVQVEGEIIRYDGKQFSYYNASNVRQLVTVKSAEEQNKFHLLTPENIRYKNALTGRLEITERGVWNSENKDHAIEALGYSVRRILNGARTLNVAGFKHDWKASKVNLSTGPRFSNSSDILLATRGNEGDSAFFYYGARLKFNATSRTDQRAGIVIHNNGANENGYFIELQQSNKVDRKQRKELLVYTKTAGNPIKNKGKGRAVNVIAGRWYDIDVAFSVVGSTHRVQVSLNGRVVQDVTFSGGTELNTAGGKFGMFVRGQTDADFEYLYGVRQPPGEPIDGTSFWDRVNGGYMGSQWDTEWVYRWRTVIRRKKKKKIKEQRRWNLMYMDEFGPWVHEIREFDVKFDPKPVLYTKFMLSSPEAICLEYNSNSFGAKFILANMARRTTVVQGEDSLSFAGTNDAVNQVLMIFGRVVEVQDEQTIIRKNDAQIKIRGKIESEINSPWIQSEAAAIELGDWINAHWSQGADEWIATVFGNTAFEIGDVVSIEYPEKFMTAATHKYFITSIETQFNQGIETILGLRRVV